MLDLVLDICNKDYDFEDFEKCRDFFKNLINELRQMNYTAYESEQFWAYNETVKKMIA
jgi:V/A-type H+-transporting ATPase subunit A